MRHGLRLPFAGMHTLAYDMWIVQTQHTLDNSGIRYVYGTDSAHSGIRHVDSTDIAHSDIGAQTHAAGSDAELDAISMYLCVCVCVCVCVFVYVCVCL